MDYGRDFERIEVKDRDLKVRMSDQEVALAAKRLGRLCADRRAKESEFDAAKEAWKADDKRLGTEISTLEIMLEHAEQVRAVPCVTVANWTTQRREVYRLDTSELIDQAPLRDRDRQLHMLHEADASSAGAGTDDASRQETPEATPPADGGSAGEETTDQPGETSGSDVPAGEPAGEGDAPAPPDDEPTTH